ncbi:hypothetical protein PHYPSEUDO_012205 [Phytophthora pseudosyringae]|uniref:Uncharacterized protein n=1 Tax=Phytophthora pseudosyringae TaxID=221518 RepID=A0A8T1W779_9STRA|nr:hypothetical protein PHYPSEUDO_012205 [Phytophthora pseudosyringae]
MTHTDLLQGRINLKQEKHLPTYEKLPDIVAVIREVTKEKIANAEAASVKIPLRISLDTFIAFREEFSGGWNVWLGDEELATLTPDLKQELPAMTFDEKSSMFFCLSVWSKRRQTRTLKRSLTCWAAPRCSSIA